MSRILNINNPTGKTVLILFFVTQIFYAAIIFYSIPQLLEYTNGQQVFDMMPLGYTTEYASEILVILGEEGRSVYLSQQIPLDMVYPGLFAISYLLIIRYLARRTIPDSSVLLKLSWIPVLAGTFDYLENIGIVSMIAIHPNFYSWLGQFTSLFTIVKSLSTTLAFLLIAILLIIWISKTFKQRFKPIQS